MSCASSRQSHIHTILLHSSLPCTVASFDFVAFLRIEKKYTIGGMDPVANGMSSNTIGSGAVLDGWGQVWQDGLLRG